MKTNQKNDRIATIESVIEAIRKRIKSNLEAGFSVERKHPAKGTSHRGLLRITETRDSETMTMDILSSPSYSMRAYISRPVSAR